MSNVAIAPSLMLHVVEEQSLMPKLECKSVTFYSERDELVFFEWIERIECIKEWVGVSRKVVLHIKTVEPSDSCLRELIAMFQRYKIEMSQLSQFLNERNKAWFFENKKAFWHKKVFID